MLKEKLLTWKYYKDKIPFYLQNSYGYSEHFKMLFDILVNYDAEGDKFLEALNITNFNPEELPTFNCTEILNNFATLYGLNRTMTINNELLTLSDEELLKLILVKIIQINYDGTRETFLQFYSKYFTDNLEFYLNKYLPFQILVVSNFEENSNLDKIYKYTDLLFINLLGINYKRAQKIDDLTKLAKFDNPTKKFDDSGALFL